MHKNSLRSAFRWKKLLALFVFYSMALCTWAQLSEGKPTTSVAVRREMSWQMAIKKKKMPQSFSKNNLIKRLDKNGR